MTSHPAVETRAWLFAIRGIGLCLALVAMLAGWEYVNGNFAGLTDLLFDDVRPRSSLVIFMITAFTVSAGHYAAVATRMDVRRLAPSLEASPEQLEKLFSKHELSNRGLEWAAGAVGALIGLLLVADGGGDGKTPLILTSTALTHRHYAVLISNSLLFFMMGLQAHRSIMGNRLISALASLMPPVDLLDLSPYAPLARNGLRTAFLWIGGSTLASLIYIDQEQNVTTPLVILATVGLGVFSLLQPLRGAHATIQQAKERELAAIRDAIRGCRVQLLAAGDARDPSQQISGLLAYEARIEAIRTWPLDVSTVVRFGLLVSVAVGSWLGGAVVEMLLDSAIES